MTQRSWPRCTPGTTKVQIVEYARAEHDWPIAGTPHVPNGTGASSLMLDELHEHRRI